MISRGFWCGAILAVAPIAGGAQAMAGVNPVYRRAQAMVNDGNAIAGRALVDSMIAVAPAGSNDYAEGVYWRAVLAATAVNAEMDYRRIVVDYSLSPRVGDALIRLAQLEIARANYDGALRHLNRLVVEHPESPARARAGYWTARALFDKNDIQGGCASTADALLRTAADDSELRNQIAYLNQRCAGVVLAVPGAPATAPAAAMITPPPTTVTRSDTGAVAVTVLAAPPVAVRIDSARAAVVLTPEPVKNPAPERVLREKGRAYSVQVAAYNVKSQADAMVARLKKNGYEARVDGKAAPFRVRIGKYATQSQAAAVQRSLKTKQITGFVVQADTQ